MRVIPSSLLAAGGSDRAATEAMGTLRPRRGSAWQEEAEFALPDGEHVD